MNAKNLSEKHGRVVKDFIEAFSNLNKDLILKCLNDDVVWHVAPSFEMGDIVGKESVIELMFSATSEFYRLETMKFDIDFIVTNETHGAMQLTMTCQTKTGINYSNFYTLTFRFENGLISEAWEHMDTINFRNQVLKIGTKGFS